MAPVKNFDYLVIGGGSGGLASARKASKAYGAKVGIIEAGRLGGTCVNVGCVPKKVMWAASDMAAHLKAAAEYGFSGVGNTDFAWPMFKAKRDAYIKRLNGIYERNLGNDGVEYIAGRASLTSANTVHVDLNDGAGTVELSADKILVATGGYPTPATAVKGYEHGIDSDGFFELETQPKRVAIVGAGYIAVEFAGMFNGLGSETDLFIRHNHFLRSFDPVISETLTAYYEKIGVALHRQSKLLSVDKLPSGALRIEFEADGGKQTKEFDCLIWAIGRSPHTEGLNLDKVGVKTNEKGFIVVDEYQQTSVPSILALGDVCGRVELTPVAIAAGRKLADRLYGGDATAHLDYNNVPSAIFSHPEASSIGLTEQQAREKYGDEAIKVYSTKFVAMYYAMLEEKGPTAYKLVCAGPDEKVVGLHLVGEASSEIMQGFGVAVKMGATKKDFDSVVAIHPTSAEEIVTLK